jgi:hypothetical protein
MMIMMMKMNDNFVPFCLIQGDSLEDYWDDTELIKAYEEAVKENRNLRTCNGTGFEGTEVEESKPPGPWCESTGETVLGIGTTVLSSENSQRSLEEIKQDDLLKGGMPKWKVNSYCRAVYSEDGVEYEAQIVEIPEDNSSAIVRFIGMDLAD